MSELQVQDALYQPGKFWREASKDMLEELSQHGISSFRSLKTSHEDSSSAYHLYIIRLQNSQGKSDRKILLEALRDKDVQAHVHYIPLHTQPYYQQFGFKEGDFPEAENYYSEAMTLPIYSAMSSIEQDTVVRELKAELQSLGINR